MERDTPGAIGERIMRFRKDADLSLNELAKRTDIAKSYLWSLENDPSSSRPSGEALYLIAEALGVTMSDLLGRKLLSEPAKETPKSLKEFAREMKLPEADVRMLASIRFRGEQPQTKERWAFIYDAIRTSRMIDRENAPRKKA